MNEPRICEWCDQRPVMLGTYACGTCALDDLGQPGVSQDDAEAIVQHARAEAEAEGRPFS